MLNTEDSLKKRYFAKLFANLVGLVISLVTQAIIPRGLGPRAYGDFTFLSNFFTQVVGFADMGTSIGFYTKLSQRQRDFGLVSFYFRFACLASLLVFVFVLCAQATGAYVTLWPGQKLFYIYLAAVWGILTWFVQIVNKMADAYGVTVYTEIARIMQKGVGLILILALFFTNQLNLTHFFFYHYFILIFLILAFIWVMEKQGYSLFRSWRLTTSQFKAYTKEFYHYSHPLVVYALIGLIVGILDRWLLQYFSGSMEQGFFGLSYKIGSICFLFTSAMTPLIMREFSIAFGKKDIKEMARLFRRYIPMLYAIAAYFACFIAMQADTVTYLLGGKKFHQAALAVAIMAFYPIHQTYGQLCGSVFYATGQTGLYRNIGISFMLIGLPITWIFLAPADKFGLGLGSEGLAIKMVVLQLIGVNVQLFFNARLLNLQLRRYIIHQIGCVSLFVIFAFLAREITSFIPYVNRNIIINFLSAGVFYTILVVASAFFLPPIFGLYRKDIQMVKEFVAGRFFS